MSGTIPLSMTQQFDVYGKPLAGGQLYLIQAGTVSTPQNGFQDAALTIAMPNPITLDAAGRIPQFFLADGLIKVRLQDKTGVVQLAADGIQVIGPSSGGGGGGTAVDPNALIQTGNMILRYGVGVLSGYVRLNGLSIGSAASGATERSNADCQPLFLYLWNADANLVVSGGRTSAAGDWSANKQLSLPDWRGYNIGGLDDMGNAPANRMGGFFANPTILGSAGGVPSMALAAGNLPAHVHGGTTAIMNGTSTHSHSVSGGSFGGAAAGSSGPGGQAAPINTSGVVVNPTDIQHTHNFVTDNGPGLATAFSVISPRKLCTVYIKL